VQRASSQSAVSSGTGTGRSAVGWELQILYDGDCPLCSREIAALRRLDRKSRLSLVDIAAPGFDPSRYGLDRAAVMGRIHAALPDGRVVEGMEVFRRAYRAVGLGWLLAPSRWPGLRRLFDAAYRVFARNRLRWTGRQEASCGTERCSTPGTGFAGGPGPARARQGGT
jgi:predicted DCC family thiol-disulfide oxidoreductase YuxK